MNKSQKSKPTTKLTLFKSGITVQGVNKKQNSLANSLSSQIIKQLKGETADNFPQIGKRNLSQDKQIVVSTRTNTKRINSFNNSRLVSPSNRKISAESTERKDLLMNTAYVNISKKVKENKESLHNNKNNFTKMRNSSYDKNSSHNTSMNVSHNVKFIDNIGDLTTQKNTTTTTDNNLNKIIDSPEELHFVQVNFFQQNKIISNKFG
jgi:hypothetical protein